MIEKDKINIAFKLAFDRHYGQYRNGKLSGIPYIIHPMEVVKRVVFYGVNHKDIDAQLATILICAAILHDTVEDCEVTADELCTYFGERVRDIVLECTRTESDDATRAQKFNFLRSFSEKSLESVIIKLADRYCNVQDYWNSGKEKKASQYALEAYPLYKRCMDDEDQIVELVGSQVYDKMMHDIGCLGNIVEQRYPDINILDHQDISDIRKLVT